MKNAHVPFKDKGSFLYTKQPPKGFKRFVKLVYLFNPYPDGRFISETITIILVQDQIIATGVRDNHK